MTTRFLTLLWTATVVALCPHRSLVEANTTAAIIQYINNITLVGRTITTAGSTSEDKALKWLVTENDPRFQFVPGSAVNNTRLAQRYALATYFIENALPRTAWVSTDSECTWLRIGCSNISIVTYVGTVTTNVGAANGTIPTEVGLLSSLQIVNWFAYGIIPTTIGRWTDLNTVRMFCFTPCISTLPTSVGNWRNVLEVELLGGAFVGSLPETIGSWTNLKYIYIQDTGLIGTLPTSIGSWTNVEIVKLTINPLWGPLPTTIGQWSSLRRFDVSNSLFTGMLPDSIRNWTLIERIELSGSRFTGTMPIGNWVNLTTFKVSNNNFTGTISPTVANWTRIDVVDLQNNSFVGTIPRSICAQNLSFLKADCPNEVTCWCCQGCPAPNDSGTSGILFRELRSDAQDGSWGPSNIDIPGFDHVALSYLDSVYESHPGYKNGPVYVSADRLESRIIPVLDGVQNVHTLETFKHDSPNASTTPGINFQMVLLDNPTALALRNIITPRVNAAGFLAFNSIEEFVLTHAPSAQKGGNGKFTGCGLIEWSAEQAGINNGQGFVPNDMESIATSNGTFPLLSPELAYSALQNQGLFFSTQNYLKGYFDPVDHTLTDPIGRRTGVVNRTQYREIPNAFESPKGDVETIVVVNPIPGEYVLKVYGIPGKKGVASAQVSGRPSVTVRTNGDASVQEESVVVPVVSGSRGDVNGDGAINQTDLTLLKSRIPQVVTGFASTADMNGDGQLNQTDVDILTAYLNRLQKTPTVSPNRAPRAGDAPVPSPILSPNGAPVPPPSGSCSSAGGCSNGFVLMYRTRQSRCIERCILRLLLRLRLLGKVWKCGKCAT